MSSRSRTQGSTAVSSAESELYALVTGATEAEHAAHILEELQGGRIMRAILTDSNAAKAAVEKAGVGKMRHISLRYMFIKEMVAAGMHLEKVRGDQAPADLMTKALDYEKHETMMEMLPMQRMSSSQEEKHEVNIVMTEEPYKQTNKDRSDDSGWLLWTIGLITALCFCNSILWRTLKVWAQRPTRTASLASQTEVSWRSAGTQTGSAEAHPVGSRWIAPHRGEMIHASPRGRGLRSAKEARCMSFCPICG